MAKTGFLMTWLKWFWLYVALFSLNWSQQLGNSCHLDFLSCYRVIPYAILAVCVSFPFGVWGRIIPRSMWYEPSHEIMVLFVLRKLILQMRMRSHPVRLDIWFLIGPFVYFHISCVRTAKALARLRRCAGSPEHSLVAYVISTIISWAG